jgi:undecaprenyl-diphosphatase
METIQTFLLAIIQGLTEFLPISSSAHLILLSQISGWKDQGLAFDVALHFGTLLAVLYYFKNDLFNMLAGSNFQSTDSFFHSQLGIITVATVPAVLLGWLFSESIEQNLRSSMVIAIATIFFGLLLYLADLRKKNTNDTVVNLGIGFLIGLSQVFALIPGTSRSGITITAGLFLGLSRQEAAKFSFLLAIPVIIAASIFNLYKLTQIEALVFNYLDLLIGIAVSFVVAFLTIKWFLRMVQKVGMLPFFIYRLILGALILL